MNSSQVSSWCESFTRFACAWHPFGAWRGDWNQCGAGSLLAKMARPPVAARGTPWETDLARVAPFHSFDEARKPPVQRIYHDNDACQLARAIPERARRPGTGGHRLCKECDTLDRADGGRSSPWL
jgi:hypothetical protein